MTISREQYREQNAGHNFKSLSPCVTCDPSLSTKRFDREKLIKDRISNLQRMMKDKGLDFFIGTTFDTVRYITDCRYVPIIDYFIDLYAVVLPVDGTPTLFAPWIEGKAMGYSETPPPSYVASPVVAERWASLFAEALKKYNFRADRIGFDYFPYAVYEALKNKVPQATLIPAMTDLLKVRAIKTHEEVTLLRKSANILDKGMTAGMNYAKPGLSEYRIMAKMESSMREAGAESLPWLNFRSGGRTLTSIFSNGRRLKKGDAVVFDIGVMSDGYYGDAARTAVAGKPAKDMRELYDALYDSYMEGLRKVKPGVKGSEVDHTIRQGLVERGYPDYPTPSGHGIGMRVTEFPWIARQEEAGEFDEELQPGMVICIEPRTYRNNVAAVGIEDMILITDTGHELLTRANRHLH
jgi:Xaa-Pro aminopeptidase